MRLEVFEKLHQPRFSIEIDAGKEAHLEFSKCPQRKHRVIEGRYLLDCNFLAGRSMDGRTDDAIRSFAHDVLYEVLAAYVAVDMARSAHVD